MKKWCFHWINISFLMHISHVMPTIYILPQSFSFANFNITACSHHKSAYQYSKKIHFLMYIVSLQSLHIISVLSNIFAYLTSLWSHLSQIIWVLFFFCVCSPSLVMYFCPLLHLLFQKEDYKCSLNPSFAPCVLYTLSHYRECLFSHSPFRAKKWSMLSIDALTKDAFHVNSQSFNILCMV